MGNTGAFKDGLGALGAWFERQKRVLPWRDNPSLYRVWISEIMLQQTQVATVVPYFERFLERFPDVRALAEAPLDDVLLLWAGLGYYSRARNLHRAAQALAERGFPETLEGWLELPGVGRYTAGAILSIALDQPRPILDGNVERVLSRLRRVKRDENFKTRLWRLSLAFVERGAREGVQPSALNQALMELGATVCSPRRPRCEACPLSRLCRARAAGDAESFPPARPRKKWLEVREELHCLLAGDRVLLRRRAAGEWRAGLWDLPAEAPVGAELVGSVQTRHVVTRHKVARVTRVWRARAWGAAERDPAGCDARWIAIAEPEVAVGSALRRTLEAVLELLGG